MDQRRSEAKRRQRGPTDHGRRDRIADAAISLVAEEGITALSHRRVAAAAQVPLGSTTYHFSTLDALVAAAFDKAAERSIAALREWEQVLPPDADLAEALADFVLRSIGENREDTMAEYNLYALALHRPALRKAAVDWDDAVAQVLEKRTDALTGRMLGGLLCGLLIQAVLRNELLNRSDVEAVLARAIRS
ncbi:TetR/AcrR family transcriptional regulator [Streptomyces sp. NPDC002851]